MATWQHLRSSTANKRPTTSLADGRIAINTNTASPGLFFKDSAGTGIVKVGPVHVGTTAPNSVPAAGGSSGNYTGEQWLDTSVSPAQMKVWNGSTWVGIVADELPVSKLQDGAARQLIQTDAAGTGVEWTSDVDVPGTLDVTSTATFDSIAQHPLGTAGAPTITFTGDNNTGIYSPGADQVAISTNSVGRLFVDSSGRVGVGDSTPTVPLDITGSATEGLRLKSDNSSTRGFELFNNSTSDLAYISNFYNGPIIFQTNNTERMRLTSTGLGVGTSSPVSLLHVYNAGGLATVTIGGDAASSYSQIQLRNSSTKYNWSLSAQNNVDNGFEITPSTAAGGSTFSTPAVVIKSDGKVGVGTTTVDKLLTLNDTSGATLALKTGANTSSSIHGLEFYDRQGTASFPSSPGQLTSYVRSERNGGNAEFSLTFGTTNSTSANASERLRIDSSGRVGIGTSSPSELFQCQGNARFDKGGNRWITIDAGTNATYDSRIDASHTLIFRSYTAAGGTPPSMVFDTSGRLGIGSSTPDQTLVVNGGVGINNGGGSGGSPILTITNASGSPLVNATNNASALTFGYNGTEAFRVDSSRRLLVGTSSAPSALGPSIQSARAGGAYFVAANTSTVSSSGDILGEVHFLGNQSGGYVHGATISATADATWSSSSDGPTRLVFSVTQDGSASPTPRMQIANNGVFTHFSDGVYNFRTAQAASGSAAGIDLTHSATGMGNGTLCFRVWTNGNVVNTNNSYGAISDIKLKENVVNATSQWDDLKALQVRKYNFKKETGQETHTQIGLVAQEVELVSPGLVTESPDRDEDGNDLGTVTKSVNYSVLYMKAVKALQEAMERIEQLEAEMAEVKAQLS